MRLHILKRICLGVISIIMLASCHTPQNIAYFQDAHNLQSLPVSEEHTFKLRCGDKINIVVNSKDSRLESLFTLTAPSTRQALGTESSTTTVAGKSNSGNTVIAYTVSDKGTIDFPVLGEIKVEGMNRQQVASNIKAKLITENLVNDPIVTVEYANLSVSVLGEVGHAGRIDVTRDYITILDAISEAGDLTINGQRENVMVLRKEGNEEKIYTINLCSAKDMLQSPVYYLQQDDVVYVTPSDKRKRESTASSNSVFTPSFWISLTSMLVTIATLVTTQIRN